MECQFNADVDSIVRVCGSIARLDRGRAAEAGPIATSADEFPAEAGWKSLFNGKDLTGWTFRNPRAKKVWVVCDQAGSMPRTPLVSCRKAAAGPPIPCCSAATMDAVLTS